MTRLSRFGPLRVGVIFITTAAAIFGLTFGAAFASGSGASTMLPCQSGGPNCINIGFTNAWFNGQTVQLEYSHSFFCAQPPESEAFSKCEAGMAAKVTPPSGPVVSNIYVLIPKGFRPPEATLHCGVRCIDYPRTMDLSRVFNSDDAENAVLPARSFVIEESESFQSTWWPVVLVFVKNLAAWNTIAAANNIDSVDACQANGGCLPEVDTNAFVFFQVLGPGMSPQGPA
jgi:hypothetical protein